MTEARARAPDTHEAGKNTSHTARGRGPGDRHAIAAREAPTPPEGGWRWPKPQAAPTRSEIIDRQGSKQSTETTKYRAIIQSGVCSEATSNEVTITVDEVSSGGILTTEATNVCSGDNLGTLEVK